VPKELIKSSVGLLEKRCYLVVESDPTAKATKLVRLTTKGREAQDAHRQRLDVIEERWLARFGKDAIRNLQGSLERLVGSSTAAVAVVPWVGAPPQRVAGIGSQAQGAPTLPDVHSPRWVPGRQLTQMSPLNPGGRARLRMTRGSATLCRVAKYSGSELR